MDGFSGPERVTLPLWRSGAIDAPPRRWAAHSAHGTIAVPHCSTRPWSRNREELRLISSSTPQRPSHVTLDGSRGEGGGQILRTALTLSLLTGRSFRMVKIRANRDKPGLRPQHQKAVQAAVELGHASVAGGGVGARELIFWPKPYETRDLSIDIGTAGSTGLVLQTLHLPLALRTEVPTRLALVGGTYNPMAPPFSF